MILGELQLLIRRMQVEADDVLSLTLTAPDHQPLPEWTEGAHIDLVMRPDLIRQYSLCGDPLDRSAWTVAVLREPAGRGGSSHIHDVLRPGMLVGVSKPRNNFALVSASHYLLIAGGIGITPLLPMVRSLESSGADWKLLYGGRRRASMAFLDELQSFDDKVTICPQDEFGLLDLRTTIRPASADTVIYCCGPEPLISAVEVECLECGNLDLHVERFSANPNLELEASTDEDEEFELVLSMSGRRFSVPADRTIVQVLDEANIWVPTSCREGYCGACETEIISGVPDHRDTFLAPDHRETNKTMMICVGRSKGSELVLRL